MVKLRGRDLEPTRRAAGSIPRQERPQRGFSQRGPSVRSPDESGSPRRGRGVSSPDSTSTTKAPRISQAGFPRSTLTYLIGYRRRVTPVQSMLISTSCS